MLDETIVDGDADGSRTGRLQLEYPVWRDITRQMSAIGMNMVVIDVGEGIAYKSHPELAVKGTWTQERFKDEVKRLRDLGLEPIPKLNFSSTHNAWMGVYRRMTGTKKYYGRSAARRLTASSCARAIRSARRTRRSARRGRS